jgi:LysM repeat protein
MDQRTREILLLRYIDALEMDRPDVIAMILQQAEYDSILSQMIIELHRDPETVKQLLRKPTFSKNSQFRRVNRNRNVILFRGLPTVAAVIILVLSVWLLSVIVSSDDPAKVANPQITPVVDECLSVDDLPSYVVQTGDTIDLIASRFNISPDELLTANCLEASTLIGGEILAIPVVSQAVQAESTWFGYLFDAEMGRLRRVSTDGLTTVYSLGVPSSERISEDGLAISPNGELVAYCTIGNGGVTTVYLRNIVAEITIYTVMLENPSKGCKIADTAFQIDGPLLVVSRLSAQDQWQLDVIHTGQGDVTMSVNSQSTIAIAQVRPVQGEMPTVTYFDSRDWLVFAFNPHDFQTAAAYRWYLDRQVIEVSDNLTERLYGTFDFNFGTIANPLTSTEGVSLAVDEGQSNALFGANVVRQTNKAGANVDIYHNPNAILLGVQYVYDGEQTVILERPLSNLDNRDPSADSWVLLGDSVQIIADGNAIVDNAPDGLIVYTDGRLEYRGVATRLLWEGNSDNWKWVWSWRPYHINNFN